jgi:predicted acetyltransferase
VNHVTRHKATPADLAPIKNLVGYYIYDMSEHMHWPCTPDGRFDGCDDLASYWTDPGKHAFVLRSGQELAGFVLILANNPEPDVDFSVTDFFILRKFRGRGAGQRVAHELFDLFPGRWKVELFVQNQPARAFWRKVIQQYTQGRFEQRSGTSQCGPLDVYLFRSQSRR